MSPSGQERAQGIKLMLNVGGEAHVLRQIRSRNPDQNAQAVKLQQPTRQETETRNHINVQVKRKGKRKGTIRSPRNKQSQRWSNKKTTPNKGPPLCSRPKPHSIHPKPSAGSAPSAICPRRWRGGTAARGSQRPGPQSPDSPAAREPPQDMGRQEAP